MIMLSQSPGKKIYKEILPGQTYVKHYNCLHGLLEWHNIEHNYISTSLNRY